MGTGALRRAVVSGECIIDEGVKDPSESVFRGWRQPAEALPAGAPSFVFFLLVSSLLIAFAVAATVMADRRKSDTNKGSPAVRWILIAVLVIAVVVVGIELRARNQSQAAFGELESMVQIAPGAEPEDVHQRLGVEPVEAYRGEQKRYVEVYRWDGVFRTYSVYAIYGVAATKLLQSVSYNTPPDIAPVDADEPPAKG